MKRPAAAQIGVPHLRDGFIVAKVGIGRSPTASFHAATNPGAPCPDSRTWAGDYTPGNPAIPKPHNLAPNVQPKMPKSITSRVTITLALLLTATTHAQTPQPDPTPPKGEVIIQSHGEPPAPTESKPDSTEPTKDAPPEAVADITDTERAALTFTAYDLDLRLAPESSHLAMRARVTVHNDGATPLTHIALQISSSLTWESASLTSDKAPIHLPLAQHLLETDADHTGKASEAILTLPTPLAPGASLTLDTFYSGNITQDSTRLERIGAAHDEAAKADWDAITAGATALRGFGNVLWYPVAAPQVFLGQGAQLFDEVGDTKLRESTAKVHLRIAVDYTGNPPLAAYFCGRRQAFTAVSTEPDAPGLVTADFASAPLGFRIMSLFLIASPEVLAAPLPGDDAATQMLAVETTDDSQLTLVNANAKDAATLLADWLGPQPLSALTILDHSGQPFEDGPLLVAPLAALGAPDAAPALTHSLTHAWVQTGQPWMDEGLAQFFVLLGVERTQGREPVTAQLNTLLQPLTLIEPALEAGKPAPVGQPLVAATSELYYRRKAAAVWWMLRGIVGDDPLKLTLQAWRNKPASTNTPEQSALAFEALLEKTYGKDLHWFFDDWVFHDRGLPDLTLADVTPRELPASTGRYTGWLVSVTVRNDGAAVADVPLIIRSGSYSTTQRMRIPGFATITTRVVVEAAPTQVLLNDGATPEQRTSTHSRDIAMHAN